MQYLESVQSSLSMAVTFIVCHSGYLSLSRPIYDYINKVAKSNQSVARTSVLAARTLRRSSKSASRAASLSWCRFCSSSLCVCSDTTIIQT